MIPGSQRMKCAAKKSLPPFPSFSSLSGLTAASSARRLQITDGTDKTDATLAGDFYQLFSSGQLKEFSLLHVQKWMAQTVDGKTCATAAQA